MKKNLLLILIYSLLLPAGASAQLSYNTAFSLGNNATDYGYSIAADGAGNFYCTGVATYWINANPLGTPFYTVNNGGLDIYVGKYNPSGIMQWAFDIGGSGDDYALKIVLDASNNVYIAGRFKNTVDFDPGAGTANRTSNGDFDIFLAKYDNNGVFQWVNAIGDSLADQAWDISVDATNNSIIITGGYASHHMDMDPGSGTHIIYNNGNPSFNTGNCFVAAYSQATGAYQWAFNIGGFGGATGSKVAIDNAGYLYAGGTVSGDSTDFDPGAGTSMLYCASGTSKVFLAKYNSSNALQWVNGFGGNYGQTANSLGVDNNGSVYQGGYFNSDSMDIDPGPGTYYIHNYPNGVQDIYVAKFNSSNGHLNWAFDVGGYYSEVAQDFVLDNAGHFFITGNFGDTVDFDPGPGTHYVYGNLGSDAYLAEYDTAGNFIAVLPFSGNGTQFGTGVCIIPPNKVGITGFFSSDSIDFDPGPAVHNLYVNGGIATWTDAYVATYTYLPTGIDELSSQENNFSAYPNPVSSRLLIRSTENIKQCKIFDITGKEIVSISPSKTNNLELQVSDFENGIYFLQLSTQYESAVQKIVIQH